MDGQTKYENGKTEGKKEQRKKLKEKKEERIKEGQKERLSTVADQDTRGELGHCLSQPDIHF